MEEIKTKQMENNEKSQKDIVSEIFSERDSYQQSNKKQRTEFDSIYFSYAGEINDPEDKSKSQEKIMKLRTEVNYIVPSIFSGNPELEASIVGDEDKDLAYVGEKIINYRINNIPQAYEKIEAWVKQAVVFGTSIIKACWDIRLKDNGDGTKSVDVDEPTLEVTNIKDCFYNPVIADIESQNSIIFRSVLPVSEVKNNAIYDYPAEDGGFNRDKISEKGSVSTNKYDSSTLTRTDGMDETKIADGTVEIYERITKDRIQTVADGKERLLLRDVANPYGFINAVKLIHEPNAIPNRFEGHGTGHNTLGYSTLIQKLSNRLQDAVNLGNNPHFLVEKGAGVDKKQCVVYPGGWTEVDAGGQPVSNVIQPLEVPDIKNGALELLSRFDEEHKRASGANDLMQGAASNKTLGQDQLASTYSSNRFELINRRFKQSLADLGRMILEMEIQNIQSMDAPILKIFPLQAEVTDAGEIRYSRETVYQMLIAARERKDLKWNIQIKGETNIARNKDVQMKQFVDIFNLCAPMLPPQYQMAWVKKMLQLRGIDEIDKLVPDTEQNPMQGQIDPITGQPMQPQMMDQSQMQPQQPNPMMG